MEDAEVLKELYETIKQNSKADYAGIIEQQASYPYLYHLSQIRENLISFLPFGGDMRVLECNPECGALTGKLLAMTGGVTVLAESELQEKILRERFMEPQEREKLDIRRLPPEHGRMWQRCLSSAGWKIQSSVLTVCGRRRRSSAFAYTFPWATGKASMRDKREGLLCTNQKKRFRQSCCFWRI